MEDSVKSTGSYFIEQTAAVTVHRYVITPDLSRPVTFASSPVRDGLGHVPVVTLLAVVAVASRRVVPAVEADATASAARQLVQLHVEAAAAGVQVTVAGWRERERGREAEGRPDVLQISQS